MTPHSYLVLQVLVLAYSLTAGAFRSNPPSVANNPAGLTRLAIAVATGMLGVVVRNRHSQARQRSPNSILLDVVLIYGMILLSQMVLVILNPALRLPNWALTQGGFLGFMFFAATRALFAVPGITDHGASSQPGDEMEQERSHQANRHRMAYQVVSAIAVALCVLGLALTPWRGQIASALIMIGSVHLLRRTFASRTGAATGSDEKVLLAVLRSASAWHYLALLPASIIVLFGSKVYLFWVPIVILMFVEANQRAAASLKSRCERFQPSPVSSV